MSAEATIVRTRVLRGAAAAAVRDMAMGAELSLAAGAPSLVDPAAAAADAAQAAQLAREEAARVGYEDGFAAGLRAGAEEAAARAVEAHAAVDAAVVALETAAADLASRQGALVSDVETRITAMALQIAEAVVRRELTTAADPGLDAITRALQLAPGRADATARLHPDDAATVGDLSAVAGRTVTVVADPSVDRGGCVLDVGACRIDAQIAPALARVREVLGA